MSGQFNAGRINRWIQKLFYIQSGGPASVYQVESSIQPVIQYLEGAEDRYLQGWNRFAFNVGVTGGAGQTAGVELHNPLTSGVVAVVERLGVTTSATTAVSINLTWTSGPAGIADFGSSANVQRLDGRTQPGTSMIATFSNNAVGFANTIWKPGVLNTIEANYIATPNQELTLIPGSAYIVIDNTVADTLFVSCVWRERMMEQSELT